MGGKYENFIRSKVFSVQLIILKILFYSCKNALIIINKMPKNIHTVTFLFIYMAFCM